MEHKTHRIILLVLYSCSAICYGVSDEEIKDITGQIWDADDQRMPDKDCVYDIDSDDKLFTKVESGHFGKDTYKSLRNLRLIYKPTIGEEEDHPELEEEIWRFIDSVMERKPMQIAHEFLVENNLASESVVAFKDELYTWWFAKYSRSSGDALDSSGFEHVFLGEVRKSEVTGFHNWVVAYEEEKEGDFEYRYTVEDCEPSINTYSLDWTVDDKTYRKNVGGHFFCTSPEVELALYTVCFRTRTNKSCWARLEGHSVKVTTYDQSGTWVGSAYPACP